MALRPPRISAHRFKRPDDCWSVPGVLPCSNLDFEFDLKMLKNSEFENSSRAFSCRLFIYFSFLFSLLIEVLYFSGFEYLYYACITSFVLSAFFSLLLLKIALFSTRSLKSVRKEIEFLNRWKGSVLFF
jgi:hypothetical protein